MIAKTYIQANLSKLDRLYNSALSVQHGLFYSKLAIIEFCGWIEISMDDLIRRCAKRNLRDSNNIKQVEKDVIKRTYGFEYETHFRKMLVQVIGLKNVEKVERRVNPAKFVKLKGALTTLKTSRDSAAHTYLKGVAIVLDAPSLTKARFIDIYDGLTEIDRVLGRMAL